MKAPKIELIQRGSMGVWWLRYSFNGERLHYSLRTSAEREAREEAERIKYEIIHGIHRPCKRMIFDNLIERFLQAQKTHNAECSYKRDRTASKPLLKAFSGWRIDDITHLDLEGYMANRLDGKLNYEGSIRKAPGKNTVNHEVMMLKHMFNQAVDWGWLQTNRLHKVKLFSLPAFRPRYMTKDELEKLQRHSHPELWDIIVFNLSTGLRPKEIFNLKWSDIDWPQQMITILNPKNRNPRMIPMNNAVAELLLKRKQNLNSDYIFANAKGKKRTTVRTAFNAACRRAGIIDLRFYDIRKSFCTWLVTEGIDIRTVQDLSGHLNLESLEHYLAFRSDKKRQAVGVIDKLLEGIGPKSGPK